VEKYGRTEKETDDNAIWCVRFAFWITEAGDTHSEYVILLLFHGKRGQMNAPQHFIVRTMSDWLVYVTPCILINWFQTLVTNFFIHLRVYNIEQTLHLLPQSWYLFNKQYDLKSNYLSLNCTKKMVRSNNWNVKVTFMEKIHECNHQILVNYKNVNTQKIVFVSVSDFKHSEMKYSDSLECLMSLYWT